MKKVVTKVIITSMITLTYLIVWCLMEFAIEGHIVDSTVDNIMALLYVFPVWIASEEIYNKYCHSKNN